MNGPSKSPPPSSSPRSGRLTEGESERGEKARLSEGQSERGEKRRLNLALQGGGSHGAYTWGVLDEILADGRIEIDGISGTSAGAMNATVLAGGLVEGGPDKARENLEDFWRAVSRHAYKNPLDASGFGAWSKAWGLGGNPMAAFFDFAASQTSPYQFNPFNYNPLRDVLLAEVDFAKVAACGQHVTLFIAATNVETGQAKVFMGRDVTVDAVLASACLPALFQAVRVNDVAYWDGGYAGNPPLEPFITNCASPDVLLVQINPLHRREIPTSAREIMDRVNEISFNAPLLHELRHVEFVNKCLRSGELSRAHYREIFLHRVGGGPELETLGAQSKMNADMQFLLELRDKGRAAMRAWLDENFDHIGKRNTIDIAPFRAADMPGKRHGAGVRET